jgi:hypothetical protein
MMILSEATIKTHINRLLAKLALRDRVQAVVLAYETGLITPGSTAQAALNRGRVARTTVRSAKSSFIPNGTWFYGPGKPAGPADVRSGRLDQPRPVIFSSSPGWLLVATLYP